jgi:hypothetical protein
MDLKAEGTTIVNLRRIPIRYVHNVTKECRGQLGDAITEARMIHPPFHEKCTDNAEAATEMR